MDLKFKVLSVLKEAFSESEIEFIADVIRKYYRIKRKDNNNTIAGCGGYPKANNTCLYLIAFYVDERYRNQGNGLLFLKELIKYCKQNNYKCITLDVEKNNLNALKLYKKLGFVVVEMDQDLHRFKHENIYNMKLIL